MVQFRKLVVLVVVVVVVGGGRATKLVEGWGVYKKLLQLFFK